MDALQKVYIHHLVEKCNATFGCDTCPDEGYHETDGFSELWNSTIKKSDLDRYGWDANPYVWVVEFERCEKPPECIFKGYDKAPDDGSEKCLGYMYDNSDTLIPMCEKCSCGKVMKVRKKIEKKWTIDIYLRQNSCKKIKEYIEVHTRLMLLLSCKDYKQGH